MEYASRETIKPRRIKPGDTLGIVATSTPVSVSSPQTVKRAYRRLRDFGFKIIEAPNCRKTYGHTAGPLAERVDALQRLFADPEVDAILAFWGGYQSHQLLEYLDFEEIKRHPKLFIGYSDTTAIQIGIFSKTKLVTVSGPAAITFGKPTFPQFTWDNLKKIVIEPRSLLRLSTSEEFSDNRWYLESDAQMHFEKNPGWKIFRHGVAEGVIIGGNLGTMLLLAGTEYWPDLTNAILFLEEDEVETPSTIDRMFTHLRQIGVFEKVAGLVIGRFPRDVKFTETDTLEMILQDALRGYDIPVITGVDFGHTEPMITFPIGVPCRMDTQNVEITILEQAVQ